MQVGFKLMTLDQEPQIVSREDVVGSPHGIISIIILCLLEVIATKYNSYNVFSNVMYITFHCSQDNCSHVTILKEKSTICISCQKG